MIKVSVQEAQAKLRVLIHTLSPGDEVIITEDDGAVARLVGTTTAQRQRSLGSLRGTVTYIAPAFNAPLDDFAQHTK
jgi:antitoxin (DNA-binding transcriptional repressor) of toxin-antitoxin stability system